MGIKINLIFHLNYKHPQGSLGVPRKPYFYLFLEIFWGIFRICGQILRFLIKITWLLSFSSKSDAESLCRFVKNLFLNPKRAKLDQNSDFCHVRTYFCQSRRTSPCQQSRFLLLFFQKLHLSIFISKFIMFLKLICFTKQFYHAFWKSYVLLG